MKISLNWLKDYVKPGVTKDILAHKLTMAGLEVENVSTKDGDTVFELEITPNRADCLSLLGLAREISAILDKPLIDPRIKPTAAPKGKIPITVQETKDCRVYTAALIENVIVKDSPNWIKERISALGIRPINNLVDITNFCLMAYGQPLHVFDFDKIEGGYVEVRRSKKGEKIITLDGVERELDPSILVVADAKKPVAIAGIMGGKLTEVTPTTKNVLLESAYFDPIVTRRASRKLGLTSDSCYRFERGVDIAGVVKVSQRAINLILEIGGGKIIKYGKAGSVVVKNQKAITLRLEKINSYLGSEISLSKIKKIMAQLNFKVTISKALMSVVPPSSRSDIKSDVDVIEEIARIIGYDNLPETVPNIKISNIKTNPQRLTRNRIRDFIIAQGFDEAISFSLLNRSALIQSKVQSEDVVYITNPLSLDQEVLQPSMLPCLLSVLRTNINRGQKDLKVFELGKIYLSNGEEREMVSLIMTGTQRHDWRDRVKPSVDIYDLKGTLEQMFHHMTIEDVQFIKKDKNVLEQNQSIILEINQKEIGYLGEVDNTILQNYGIKKEGVLFAQVEIPFQNMMDLGKRKYVPYSNFPAIMRDVSLSVAQSVNFETIRALAMKEGGDLLKWVSFTELYLGEKIPAGMKGLIFSLLYQSDERTLTEGEVNEIHQKILNSLTGILKATIR
ncbi:MAG: phenylalanine--tRNA ligase subunit beta [Candidatus Omnitrophota bacterium]